MKGSSKRDWETNGVDRGRSGVQEPKETERADEKKKKTICTKSFTVCLSDRNIDVRYMVSKTIW